jgi:hypothetical protein
MARKNRIEVLGLDIISLHRKESGKKMITVHGKPEDALHVFGHIESESSPW